MEPEITSIETLSKRHDTLIEQSGGNQKVSAEVGANTTDFEEVEMLGKGAHGVVTKVRSLKNGKIYVMKRINLVSCKGKERSESLREVVMLKKLEHPHIIGYINSFIEDDSLFIIMEYADAGDLHKVIRCLCLLFLAHENTQGKAETCN
jgi:NIMA (never in mitosis gene a)-related kinase